MTLITVGQLGLALTYKHDPFPSYEACEIFVHGETFNQRLEELSKELDAGGRFSCVPESMRLELAGEDS